MPNWFKERYPGSSQSSSIIYRATFPIEVGVNDAGSEEQNIDSAYRLITDGLKKGELFNYQLSPSNIIRKPESGLV